MRSVQDQIKIYNTLSRQKEDFSPINAPHVGIYVCGPTVYGDAHLGHARPYITFDMMSRYFEHIGYKVRYVRNITDVGHLENDADHGEDKIAKKARIEQIEPMEIVQYYANRFTLNMHQLNNKPPSIEPRASGHIIEQILMIEEILANGYAYEKNGSVYFDVSKYNEKFDYGKLSGRKIEELMANTRNLDGTQDKKNNFDFALWKNASPEHIMRWPSPWGDGFPGWHLECSVMSTKYLGERFDIHGGGMDLLFPHHECEIAQSVASRGDDPVNYWVHNNMITINGQKMGKSLGNFITLNDLFNGENAVLEQAYSPMTIRFFILQAHYRSTLDFSNEALQGAEKGYKKLVGSLETLTQLKASKSSSFDVQALFDKCYAAMNDDFNTPITIANLFEGVKVINQVKSGEVTLTTRDLEFMTTKMNVFVSEILGFTIDQSESGSNQLIEELMSTLIDLRSTAKANKDFITADKIRTDLTRYNISLKDRAEGTEWSYDG